MGSSLNNRSSISEKPGNSDRVKPYAHSPFESHDHNSGLWSSTSGRRGSMSAMAVSLIFDGGIASRQLLQFLLALLFFHGSEYVMAVAFHGRSNVTLSSLLISKHYVIAMICSLLEYIAELFLIPEVKDQWIISSIGLMMVLIGEVIRKAGILTARRAFTHNIKIYHEEHHELVTHGIYRFIRHPGYCGFFIWATGTQIVLCNPMCIIAFTIVTWRFFYTRIPYEEFFLRQFFGSQYGEYAERVPSGLPFIK